MTKASQFADAVAAALQVEIERLRAELTFASARSLREAEGRDVVVAGKEVQLTIFRQYDLPILKGQVLVTVQIARHSLGGIVAFRQERGLVFSPDAPTRDATGDELSASGG